MHDVVQLDHIDQSVARDIHNVMIASYKVEAEILGVADFVPLHRSVEQIAAAESRFFGIYNRAKIVAVAELEFDSAETNIASLVVLPDHFRQGFGRSLVRQIITMNDKPRITVSTGAANGPAIALYVDFDFVKANDWTTDDGIAMVTLTRADCKKPI